MTGELTWKSTWRPLLFSVFSTGLLAWFFTVAPTFLFPPFLPEASLQAWAPHGMIASTIAVATKHLALGLGCFLYLSLEPELIYISFACGCISAVTTIIWTIVSACRPGRVLCLLTGIWCDYDILNRGKSTRQSMQEMEEKHRGSTDVFAQQQLCCGRGKSGGRGGEGASPRVRRCGWRRRRRGGEISRRQIERSSWVVPAVAVTSLRRRYEGK